MVKTPRAPGNVPPPGHPSTSDAPDVEVFWEVFRIGQVQEQLTLLEVSQSAVKSAELMARFVAEASALSSLASALSKGFESPILKQLGSSAEFEANAKRVRESLQAFSTSHSAETLADFDVIRSAADKAFSDVMQSERELREKLAELEAKASAETAAKTDHSLSSSGFFRDIGWAFGPTAIVVVILALVSPPLLQRFIPLILIGGITLGLAAAALADHRATSKDHQA